MSAQDESELAPFDAEVEDASSKGNTLRAAILGANDGLVSNLSLVMGVAGANFSDETVLLTGLAGLLAGACSMAMGEWISVQNSRELLQQEIVRQSLAFETDPNGKRRELAAIYRARGLTAREADTVAKRELGDTSRAVHTLAIEELRVDPHELGGSPWAAAGASFFLFPTGAIVPILPFLFAGGTTAIIGSVLLSGLALFGFGAVPTYLTGLNLFRGGLRQVVFGLGAASVAYAVGHVLGVAVAG
jgi:VIT1/CCC1 family predicted Fe2+/Mn2+ transporter